MDARGTGWIHVFRLLGHAAGGRAAPTDDPYQLILVDLELPDGSGLEILTEIEGGKRSFGLPRFEIGPPQPEKEKERVVFEGDVGPRAAG